jgi:D-arabinose 1-dehydrogenase-like Zn-dependent alcohol dehydrogenase
MKALVLEKPGELPEFSLENRDIPALGSKDVLVKVEACGICYHDILVMQGVLRRGVKDRVVLGHEISGTVSDIGSDVSSFKTGDKVVSIFTEPCGYCKYCIEDMEQRCVNGKGIGHRIDGGFAEYVKLHQNALVEISQDADLKAACIYGCPIGVAYNAINDVAKLKPGETVLITGAGGGLGVHSVQIAKAIGANVLAITTSYEKVDRITELGADDVILSDEELDFSDVAMALTSDEGVNVVIENVAGLTFGKSFRSLSQFGRMVIVGAIGPLNIDLNPAELIFRDAHLIGTGGCTRKQLKTIANMVQTNQIRPVVSRTFKLEDVLDAYKSMRNKETFGRIALTP